MDQQQLHQQRKIETTLHVGDQTVQFEHQLLDPVNLQQEITASTQSLQDYAAARAEEAESSGNCGNGRNRAAARTG